MADAIEVEGLEQAGAETAESRAETMELAERAYAAYMLAVKVGETPAQRVRQASQSLGIHQVQIRRLIALRNAPIEVRQLYLDGKLSAHSIELLQALPGLRQIAMAERLISSKTTVFEMQGQIQDETGDGRLGSRNRSEKATELEKTLLGVQEAVDPFLVMPGKELRALFQGAGSIFSKRALISLVGDLVEELTTLKATLETYHGNLRHDATAGSGSSKAS